MKWLYWMGLLTLPFLGLAMDSAAQAGKKPLGPEPKVWNALVDKAVAFLRTTQDGNGGWSTAKTPGVTGVVVTGLLQSGKVSADDPLITKALKYIDSLVNPEAGHLAGKGAKVQLQNYVTSINVMALVAARKPDKYQGIVGDAVKFLKKLQWDDGEGKDIKSDFFGGAGYDSKSRPDLSNTQFFLDALVDAGISKDDPALKNALIFVSRSQNLKSEHNDQPWAGKINDGSFIYTPATGGVTKVIDQPTDETGRPGYGSMTYAGIKSLIYCGVDKNDIRIKTALDWIKKHYTVDSNPGMPGVRSEWGLYYYYHTMAKALDVVGLDVVTDDKGVQHDWRADITAALAKRQQPNGGWRGEAPNWMEADPNLVTGYALMALSHCKPKN